MDTEDRTHAAPFLQWKEVVVLINKIYEIKRFIQTNSVLDIIFNPL